MDLDLVLGRRIEILPNRTALNPTMSTLGRDETQVDKGSIAVLRDYRPERDEHLIETCDVHRVQKWICLGTVPFRLASDGPMTRLVLDS